MTNSDKQDMPLTERTFIDGLIRASLVLVLMVLCFAVFSPFLNLMIWALILAVTLYPTHLKLASRLGGSAGKSATVIVLVGLILVGVPVVMLAGSLAEHLASFYEAYSQGTIAIAAPKESVADWPVIGGEVYGAWLSASENLPAFIEENKTGFESLVSGATAKAKSMASAVLLLLGALIVAGIMMAYGENGSRSLLRVITRIAGSDQGPQVHTLATMTTRSVAVGVLGVAVIQALLLGVGFLLAGIPAAGILALIEL